MWLGKRGTSPPAGEYSQNQERRNLVGKLELVRKLASGITDLLVLIQEQKVRRYDPLLSSADIFLPCRQYSGIGYKGIRSYQTPEKFAPIWLVDSAYGTVPVSNDASHCPKKGRLVLLGTSVNWKKER